MPSLLEWRFEFDVTAPCPIPRAVIDDLLDEAIRWAEARRLGIGGGYRPITPEVAHEATAWSFLFGLCIQDPNLSISESEAADLRDHLDDWCADRGLTIGGGFRAFTADD